MRPCLSRVGEPCAVNDPRRRISAFPHVDGSACSLFDIAASPSPVSSCTESPTGTFTFRTLMPRFSHVRFPSSSLTFSGLFTSRLFCCCCIVHPPHKRTKTYGKPRKPHTSRIPPSVVSCPVSQYFVVSFTSRARLPSAPPLVGLAVRRGRAPSERLHPPRFPSARSTKPPALLQPAFASLPL
ncbi:hypothetical protein OH77DRAFT_610625 [Trametes cingulata]|nr:hypothetical protein OH77DRAFT_610625 [Trametes cingulata]